MRSARIGSNVTISPYDWRAGDSAPYPDDLIRPATQLKTIGERGGTIYAITDIRRVIPRKRLPQGIVARYHIRAIKLGAHAKIPDDSRVLTLVWDSRDKKRRG